MEAPSFVTYSVRGLAVTLGQHDIDANEEETVQSLLHERKVFESASFTSLAKAAGMQAAEIRYSKFSERDVEVWRTYLNVRRETLDITPEAIARLEAATSLDCFDTFRIWRNPDTHEAMLVGLIDNTAVYPIAFWAPEGHTPLTPKGLLGYRIAIEEADAQREAARATRAEKARQETEAKRQKAQRLTRICWAVFLPLLTVLAVLFALIVGWWAALPVLVMALAAWIIHGESYVWDIRRTVVMPLLILSVVAALVCWTTFLQFGTSTKELTLCSGAYSYSGSQEGYTYETPEGDEYTVSRKAYQGIVDRTSPGTVHVRASVVLHTFFGTPEVKSVSNAKDAYDACM